MGKYTFVIYYVDILSIILNKPKQLTEYVFHDWFIETVLFNILSYIWFRAYRGYQDITILQTLMDVPFHSRGTGACLYGQTMFNWCFFLLDSTPHISDDRAAFHCTFSYCWIFCCS